MTTQSDHVAEIDLLTFEGDAKRFVRACKRSADAWVYGNNSGNPETLARCEEQAGKYQTEAKVIAARRGCTIDWPGLYPVLHNVKGYGEYATSDVQAVARFFREAQMLAAVALWVREEPGP